MKFILLSLTLLINRDMVALCHQLQKDICPGYGTLSMLRTLTLSTKTVQPKPVSSYSVGRRRKYNLRSHTTVEMILTRNESYGRHGPSRFRSGVLWHASMMQSEGDERDISFLTLIHR
jgi:hypothetical protein